MSSISRPAKSTTTTTTVTRKKAAPKKKRAPRQRARAIRVRRGQRLQIVGRGPYSLNDVMDYAPAVGAGVGSLFGPAGAVVGSGLGSAAQKLAGYISGRGKYKVKSNSLINPGQSIPTFGGPGDVTRIRHRELIALVVEPANNNGAFINRTYALNPSLPLIGFSGGGFLPWGSSIACNFQQYRILGLVFEYVTRASPINNAAAGGLGLGVCCMATNYDSIDNRYASMMIAENSQYAVSFNPAVSAMHEIECEPSLTSVQTLYTRESAVPANADQRMYDLGLFQFLTQGLPASTTDQIIGELWCNYDIALVKPVMMGGIAGGCVISWKWLLPIATVSATNTAYFGNPSTAAVLDQGSSVNPPQLSNNGTITFAAGTTGVWKITYVISGASTNLATAMNVTQGANISNALLWVGDTLALRRVAAGATTDIQFFVFTIKFNGPSQSGNTVALTAGTLPTAITGADLYIQQVASDFSP